MTRKILMTTATIAALAGAPLAYAETGNQGMQKGYDANHRLELSDDIEGTMLSAKGADVVLSDGTRLGTITEVMSDGTGDAKFFVEVDEGTTIDAEWLDITVSPANVSINENVVGLNATETEINTAAAGSGESDSGEDKATVILQ
ncbi:PRC-barrel domain-containing protein [Sulfitobacter sp. D35]|uniref:PRC-barrel domain-containing protein n=1 Tax=Sulfitobacter sp. D35 TaxID=3083252 RepID=UPI00296FA7D3|nr:PRC-barrel domain-containing protein [Sulfitobacter sp. D35]MDW4497520.1 PRC-barrel domain-containing protein [Sulfitobacter sp. D35]